jgi:hypothetical protein
VTGTHAICGSEQLAVLVSASVVIYTLLTDNCSLLPLRLGVFARGSFSNKCFNLDTRLKTALVYTLVKCGRFNMSPVL